MNKIDKYLDRFLKIILPTIFIVPFIVNANFYFPFITPRNFFFRIIITIVLAIYLWLFFRNRAKYSFGKNKIVLAYLSFAIVLTIASLLGGDFIYSFWSNYERMEGLIGLYYIIALLIVILGVYRSKKAWLDLLRISVWTSLLMAIMAMSQHWNVNLFIESAGGGRVTGSTGNATYLSVYSLFNLFFALYLLFRYKNKQPKLELWLFYILDILLIIFEIFGQGKGILVGIFSDVRIFLLFIIPQIFINLQYYFYNKNKTIRYSWPAYFILIALLNFEAILNAQTRGVLVGIFVAAIVSSIFLLISKYVNKKIKYIILAGLISLILFTTGIFYAKDSSFIQSNTVLRRITSISISDTTTETRVLAWKLSLKAFKEKPIFGWGEEKFYVVFNKYFPTEIFKGAGSRVWFDRPHNVFLQQLVDGGILGLLAYLAIFWFALHNLWKHYRRTHDPVTISILGGLLIAYLIQNFFVFDSINSYIPLILFLAISVFLTGDYKENKNIIKSNNILATLSVIVVLVFGLSLNILQIKTNTNFINQYNNLQKNISQGKYKKADVEELLATINSQYFGKFELRQVYAEFVPQVIQAKILSPEETKYLIDTAEENMLASINEQSDNVRHDSFLINLYLRAAVLDPNYSQKGVDLINNQALALSPTRIQLYYSLGQFYMDLGQNDQAIANFIKAKDLAPKVFDSYFNLFIAYLSTNNLDQAKSTISEMENNADNLSLENYARLAKVYQYFKYPDEADNLKNKAIEKLQ